jgi:hypothetical protein
MTRPAIGVRRGRLSIDPLSWPPLGFYWRAVELVDGYQEKLFADVGGAVQLGKEYLLDRLKFVPPTALAGVAGR